MRNYLLGGALASALTFISAPAQACRIFVPVQLGDVKYADTVVVGRIVSYRIIKDAQVREERRKDLASGRPLSPANRKMMEEQTEFLSDYAQFDVAVDEVLKGAPPKVFTVTWDNSTFGEPASMAQGKYLIAVRNPASPGPPLRGPSATFFPNQQPWLPTLLQTPCSQAFVFEADSEQARQVRRIVGPKRR